MAPPQGPHICCCKLLWIYLCSLSSDIGSASFIILVSSALLIASSLTGFFFFFFFDFDFEESNCQFEVISSGLMVSNWTMNMTREQQQKLVGRRSTASINLSPNRIVKERRSSLIMDTSGRKKSSISSTTFPPPMQGVLCHHGVRSSISLSLSISVTS